MRRCARMTVIAVVMVMLCAVAMPGLTAASDRDGAYEVGRFWEYTHEGPRPGAAEPNAINGRRILQVLETVDINDASYWVLEDRFTNDPNVVARLHVRGDRMLSGFVIENEKGESLAMTYAEAVPYQRVDIDVDGRMRIETTLISQADGFRLPSTIEITRDKDETVETPAGVFDDCRQYRSVTESVIDITVAKIAVKEQRQWWYSDRVGGTVKEVYTKDAVKFLAWSRDGYMATSVLAGYGIRGVSDEAQAAAIQDANVIAAEPSERRSKQYWPAIVVVAVCIGGGVLMIRYVKNRKAA